MVREYLIFPSSSRFFHNGTWIFNIVSKKKKDKFWQRLHLSKNAYFLIFPSCSHFFHNGTWIINISILFTFSQQLHVSQWKYCLCFSSIQKRWITFWQRLHVSYLGKLHHRTSSPRILNWTTMVCQNAMRVCTHWWRVPGAFLLISWLVGMLSGILLCNFVS